jgi:hypothetical protein
VGAVSGSVEIAGILEPVPGMPVGTFNVAEAYSASSEAVAVAVPITSEFVDAVVDVEEVCGLAEISVTSVEAVVSEGDTGMIVGALGALSKSSLT